MRRIPGVWSDPHQIWNQAERLGLDASAPAQIVAIDPETRFTLAWPLGLQAMPSALDAKQGLKASSRRGRRETSGEVR